MPIPPTLLALFDDPEFWAHFFFEAGDKDYSELRDCRVEFAVTTGYSLTLDFAGVDVVTLGLQHPGSADPVRIAWDDMAHWHPHALRWDELDLICRCVALNEPDLYHPGLPLLLLYRFAPICLGDDVDVILPLLASAYLSLDVVSEQTACEYIERIDHRRAAFIWRNDPVNGWWLDRDARAARLPRQIEAALSADESCSNRGVWDVLRQAAEVYTLRQAHSSSFPYVQWNQMIALARSTYSQSVQETWMESNARAGSRFAQEFFETSRLDRLPKLAKALRRAGCTNRTILDAFRPDVQPAQASWIIELLLGLEPGLFVKRFFGPADWNR